MFEMTRTEKDAILDAVRAAYAGVKQRGIDTGVDPIELSAALYEIQDFCGDIESSEVSLDLPKW